MRRSIKSRRVVPVALLLSCMLLLSGCMESLGVPDYNIVYPSGREINPYSYPKSPMSLEGSELLLAVETYQTDNGSRSDFRIIDTEGKQLFSKEGTHHVVRGLEEKGRIWISAEAWTTSQTWGFIDDRLGVGTIYCIDKADGRLLLEGATDVGELFLTVSGDRAYFYHRGNDPKSELFGLKKTPVEYATVFYRHLEDWAHPVVVATFAYGGDPDEYEETIWVHENEGTINPIERIHVGLDKLIRKDVEIGYQTRVAHFNFTVEQDQISLEVVGEEYIKDDPANSNKNKVFFRSEMRLE